MCRPSLAAFAKGTNFLHGKKRICPTNSWVMQFLAHRNFPDVCRQNAFHASVANFVADVEVSRRLDRRNGKMQFCRLCKACKNNFAVAVLSDGRCKVLFMRRACPLPRQTICNKKTSANPCVQKANLRAESQKQTSGKYFFNAKNGKQQISFFCC